MRDRTGSIIFLLHHMTKAQAEAIELAYMPQLKFVRGSGRVLDYVNQVWLLHRPNFYRDLMEELKKGLELDEMKQVEQMFLIDIALNRSGDTGTIRINHNIKISRFYEAGSNAER
jgi:replicative DNA helicase